MDKIERAVTMDMMFRELLCAEPKEGWVEHLAFALYAQDDIIERFPKSPLHETHEVAREAVLNVATSMGYLPEVKARAKEMAEEGR